jgi:hypothetical protein
VTAEDREAFLNSYQWLLRRLRKLPD